MRMNGVQYLLMGGQACVLYGGAEFSRDTDILVLANPENFQRLQNALTDLKAECIAVPPFEARYLEMGLAVHFRCRRPDAANQRIDLMTVMRGVAPFTELWERRTTFDAGGELIDVIALPDLVRAKKTQRDKDWPMIARVVEANYFEHQDTPTLEQIDFWLREMRTHQLLIELANRFPEVTQTIANDRKLLNLASNGDEAGLRSALKEEEEKERAADREYWLPLRRELERLRSEARPKP
jgi:hypothetical protein